MLIALPVNFELFVQDHYKVCTRMKKLTPYIEAVPKMLLVKDRGD